MLKAKNSTKVLAMLVAFVVILTALIFLIPHNQTHKVEAMTLTDDQLEDRRKNPGIYKTGTTELVKSNGAECTWSALLTWIFNDGHLSFSGKDSGENPGEYDLVCGAVTGLTNLKEAFKNRNEFATIDCYNLDTSGVTDMASMFEGCSNLEKIYLSKLNTNNVTDMSGMFAGCSSLQTLDLSGFNTANVTSMVGMFFGCNLKELNIENFVFNSKCDVGQLFVLGYEYCVKNLSESVANQIYYGKENVDSNVDIMVDRESRIANAKKVFLDMDDGTEDEAFEQTAKLYFGTSIDKIIVPKTKISDGISISLPGSYVVDGSGSTKPISSLTGMEGKTLVLLTSTVPSTGVASNILSVVVCLTCLSTLVIMLTNKKREMTK